MSTTHTESWGITPSKWRAKVTFVDGIRFASKVEAKRYSELKLLERGKKISGLRLHPAYTLEINGVRVGKYTSDFEFTENGKLVTEEVKGYAARDYGFRAKVFKALYPDIEHREVLA